MRSDLISALRAAHGQSTKGRWARLAQAPYKILYPILARRMQRISEVVAPTFYGRDQIVVLPEPVSVTIWRYGFFEEDVAFYLLSVLRSGGTFMDIGGHFGHFSMLGAELVGKDGRVVTFEPMPTTRALLERNIAQNMGPCDHHLIPSAAGRETGSLQFQDFGIVGSAYATSSDARSQTVESHGTVEVSLTTVDTVVGELGLEALDLIKIDAENAEDQVIDGAVNTLATLKPAVILETGDFAGSKARPLIDGLMARGYQPFEYRDFALIHHTPSAQYGYQNILLVHSDRLDGLNVEPQA